MEFNEYQKLSAETDQRPSNKDELNRLIPLLGLIGEIGSVASEHKKRLRDGQSYTTFHDKFKEELGDVLWYISTLAGDVNITLEDIAVTNLSKTKERWAEIKNFLPDHLYDDDFPVTEQLPRELTIEFKSNDVGKMSMFLNGNQLGNNLTDNAHEEDGYRFHDVFHLSFMANLGWSPVIRKLLEKKRKSNKKVDEVEDGARAGIIEEAISAMVYEHAKDHNFYQDISIVDYEVLKTIKGMVRNFEVKNISSSLWEKSILEGFEVYRVLKQNNGGRVLVSIQNRKLIYIGKK